VPLKKSGIRRVFSPHEVRCAANGGGAEVGFAHCSEGAWGRSPHWRRKLREQFPSKKAF